MMSRLGSDIEKFFQSGRKPLPLTTALNIRFVGCKLKSIFFSGPTTIDFFPFFSPIFSSEEKTLFITSGSRGLTPSALSGPATKKHLFFGLPLAGVYNLATKYLIPSPLLPQSIHPCFWGTIILFTTACSAEQKSRF